MRDRLIYISHGYGLKQRRIRDLGDNHIVFDRSQREDAFLLPVSGNISYFSTDLKPGPFLLCLVKDLLDQLQLPIAF